MLRHQQKLHQHIFQVARRGLLPASLPHTIDASAASSISNENIIILNNNTKAKAPLLSDQLERLSPNSLHQLNLPLLSVSNDSPREQSQIPDSHGNDLDFTSLHRNSSLNGNMPSPHTNSSTNTPSFQAKNSGISSVGDSDLQIAPSSFIQQPSPLTGNSPPTKENKSEILEGLAHSHDSKFSLNFQDFNRIRKRQPPNQRYASFSAVSGLSYTNLQDALTIQKSQIDTGFPPSAYSHDKGLIKGDLVLDFGNLDLDWYSMDFGSSAKEVSYQGMDPMDVHHTQSNNDHIEMKVPASQMSSNVPGSVPPDYFSNHIMTTHQFLDPNHPHHIKGTTPLALEFGPNESLSFTEENLVPVGTGFAHLTGDLGVFGGNPVSTGGSPKEVAGLKQKRSRPPSKQTKKRNSSQFNDNKKAKKGFVNEVENLDWLEQIKGIPVLNEFPSASNITGFMGMPYIAEEAQAQSDEVFSLFKVRQEDIVRQRSEIDNTALINTSGSEKLINAQTRSLSRAQFTIGESKEFITEELRSKIIEVNDLTEEQFPNLEDLNDYMNLYEKEFNSYFPFIHTATLRNPMIDNFENIPLILSMCSIGAVYSYHDSNTLLLFNLSKLHIHKFFEKEVTVDKLQFKKVPIMAHQCLVLHMFTSMFLNEPNMVEITLRQMNSMVGLIKSTNFHRPLEEFLVPPPKFTSKNDSEVIQNNYDYFIMTQTRIRTIQTFFQMEIMRSLLLGSSIPLSGMEIACGTHCNDERLWEAADSTQWYNCLQQVDGVSLVDLSNNGQMSALLINMESGNGDPTRTTYKNFAALLMYVHERILQELHACKGTSNAYKWRMEHRPKLSALLKTWEENYFRNGGRSFVRQIDSQTSDLNSDLKLIMPFFYLAKIRICTDFTPVTERVLNKDWPAMGEAFGNLGGDTDALKEASTHAVEILNLWTENILELKNKNLVSVRTPVFFITAVFIAVMIVSRTLMALERSQNLSVADMSLWSTLEKVLKTVETTLDPSKNSSYSDFLRKQCRGIFDAAWSGECRRNIQMALQKLREGSLQAEDLQNCKLLTQALGLGVRILADAPLWPLAMSFAEALKSMALIARG